jgi:hypothetical protein
MMKESGLLGLKEILAKKMKKAGKKQEHAGARASPC